MIQSISRLPHDGRFWTALTNRPGKVLPFPGILGGIWVELSFPAERKVLHPDVLVKTA